MAFWKMRLKPHYLLVRQPVQVTQSSLLKEPESNRADHINGPDLENSIVLTARCYTFRV